MADVLDNTLVNQGVFRNEAFISNQNIASGQPAGDLVTIGEAGKIVKLTYLATTASAPQSGITVTADGVDVVSAVNLDDSTPTGNFAVSALVNTSATASAQMMEVVGEFITISCNTTTSQTIRYSYQLGSVK